MAGLAAADPALRCPQMDGLLLDSEIVYTVVVNDLLRPYGKEQTWAIKARLMGTPDRVAVTILFSSLWPPRAGQAEEWDESACPFTIDEFLAKRNAQVEEAFKHVRPLPGVVKLISHLKSSGVPIAIATSSKRSNFDVKRAANPELFDLFGEHFVTGDDPRVERGKPNPDIFLLAAREGLGHDEGRWDERVRLPGAKHDGTLLGGEKDLLVFEDGRPGVTAARRAGMNVVWIPDPELLKLHHDQLPGHPDSDADAPHQTLTTMLDFKPEEWGLPPYPKS